MAEAQWELGGVLNGAVERFKQHWTFLVVATAVVMAIPTIISLTVSVISAFGGALVGEMDDDFQMIGVLMVNVCSFVGSITSNLLSTYLGLGILKVYLKVLRGEAYSAADFKIGARTFFQGILANVLIAIACMLGFVLCIIPGVIAALGLSFTLFFIVDQDMGAIDALKASWAMNKSQLLQLLIFGVAASFAMGIGAAFCFLPIFAVVPIVGLAFASIYDINVRGLQAHMGGVGGPGPAGPPAPATF